MTEDWTNNDDWLKSYNLNRAAADILEIEHDEGMEEAVVKDEDDNIDVGVEEGAIDDDELPVVSDDAVFDASNSQCLTLPTDESNVQSLS